MKKVYDLKQVIDQNMQAVKIDTGLQEAIKAKCLAKKSSRRVGAITCCENLPKVVAWVIGIVLVLSGTAYAMNYMEGFSKFIDEDILQNIAPHVQNINKGSGEGDVKMVVESAITDHYSSLLTFSFINESEIPWAEGTTAGYWNASWTSCSVSRPPVLSEDGRKLTYLIRGSNSKDILKNKVFELKAGNIIRTMYREEAVDISLGELFEAHGIVLDTIDYNYSSCSKNLYMKLDRILNQKIGRTQQQVLNSNPEVTFEYVGMIQDSRLEDPLNPAGGLTIFTRNKSNKYWTDSGDNYTVGVISEVVDTRTGDVYKANLRAQEYDVPTLWRGALGISQFRELRDPSSIPYLKATKVTYEVQEVLVKENWKVKFQVEDTTTSQPIKTHVSIREGSESLVIDQVDCSVFGITIQGTKEGQLEDQRQLSILDKMQVALRSKDGTVISLEHRGTISGDGRFVSRYHVVDENRDNVFISDVEQIKAIIINEEEVLLP